MKSHRERASKVREAIDNNKVFSVVVVILFSIIVGSVVMNKISAYKAHKAAIDTSINEEQVVVDTNINEQIESVTTTIERDPNKYYVEEIIEEDSSENEQPPVKNDKPHWRFYWIDLWILLGGGGFCLIKILQEKKKAREKL